MRPNKPSSMVVRVRHVDELERARMAQRRRSTRWLGNRTPVNGSRIAFTTDGTGSFNIRLCPNELTSLSGQMNAWCLERA